MSSNEPPVDPPGPPSSEPPAGGYGGYPPPPGQHGAPPPPPYGGAPYGAPPGGGEAYNVGTAWGYGWSKFTANLGQILVAVLILVGVQVALQLVSYLGSDSLVLTWVLSLVGWIVSMIIGAGIVRAGLDITEGKAINGAQVVVPHRLGEVVVASVIIGLATFVGLILCVLPGLAVMYFTSFTLYFLMDRPDLGAIDAIKASFEFTKNHAGQVIVWFLLSLATWFVGALLCGVGLVAAIPVVLIGTAYTYKKLTGQPVAA